MVESFLIGEGVLREAIDKLRNAFVDRPVADGRPYDDIDFATEKIDNFIAMNHSQAETNGGTEKELLEKIDALIAIYHDFWRRPFPDGLARGQILLSGIMEQMLKILLKTFEQMIKLDCSNIDNPVTVEIVLQVDTEREKFVKWIKGLPVDSYDVHPSNASLPVSPPPKHSSDASYGFGSLAVSFLLGWQCLKLFSNYRNF